MRHHLLILTNRIPSKFTKVIATQIHLQVILIKYANKIIKLNNLMLQNLCRLQTCNAYVKSMKDNLIIHLFYR